MSVEDRLSGLEDRLEKIEQRLGLSQIANTATSTTSPIVPRAAVPQDSYSPIDEDFKDEPHTAPKEQKTKIPDTYETPSGTWLGIIAIICFILAAGFIIKLSIDSGWLTPARQVGIAAIFGFGLIGTGFLLPKEDRDYVSLLPGAGIIILYLSTFAAQRIYGLIPMETALCLTSAVSLFCIWLYTRLDNLVYAITAALGAYLSPLILNSPATESLFAVYYYLVCSATFTFISIKIGTRLLIIIPAYLAILLTSLIGLDIHNNVVIAVALGAQFVILSLGTFLYSKALDTKLSQEESYSFLPVLLLFYASEYYFIEQINSMIAPWVSLGFAGFLISLYAFARKLFPENLESSSTVIAFATIVAFHSVYLELLPENFRPWLLVLIVAGISLLPLKAISTKGLGLSGFPLFAILAIIVIEYFKMTVGLFLGDEHDLPVCMAALCALWLMIVKKPEISATERDLNSAVLTAAHILAILGFYRLTHEIGSLAVSGSWLLYAVAVISLAYLRQDRTMARSALFVLGFAACKALLYDASSAPTIIRIVCLMMTGIVLYGSGFLLRQIDKWEKK